MHRFYKYILLLFLLLPKIPLSAFTGIMIGELLLFGCSGALLIADSRSIVLKPMVTTLLAFFTFFILVSSIINAVVFGGIPVSAIVYFVKVINYFTLSIVAYRFYLRERYERSLDIFVKAYVWHFIIAMSIVVIFYATHRPSIGEILWNYDTGLRLIPIAGLSVSPGSFAGLAPIGGGSSNLFVSWSLAFALIVLLAKHKHKGSLVMMAFFVPLLGMSRGGILTFFMFFVYMFAISRSFTPAQKVRISSIAFVFILLTIYAVSTLELNIPNVFERFAQTFEGSSSGRFDASTQGRFENYGLVFDAWSGNPLTIIFGLGMDEAHLIDMTGWGLVESFFLQVLFCGGIVGLLMLFAFFSLVFLNRNRNIWFHALWLFILLESIFMWTVTGGDFYSAHVMYVIMVFLGYGYGEYKLKNKALSVTGQPG